MNNVKKKMARLSAYVPKDSPSVPEKVECSKCGRDSGLPPYLTIKNLSHCLTCNGWVPSPDSPGEWVCPECWDELAPDDEYV